MARCEEKKQKSEINVRRFELNRQHLFVLPFDVWYDERARARTGSRSPQSVCNNRNIILYGACIVATLVVADAATCALRLIVVTLNVQSNCNPTMRRRPKRE